MTDPIKTLDEVNAEYDARMAELTGVENALLQLHEREGEIRTALTHLMIQRERQAANA